MPVRHNARVEGRGTARQPDICCAVCSCGWEGKPTLNAQAAQDAAVLHVRNNIRRLAKMGLV